MIGKIEWSSHPSHSDELPSPFLRGKGERSLRITLHSESLTDLSADERDAIDLTRKLNNLKLLTIYDTVPGNYPHIVVCEKDPKDDYFSVDLMYKGHNLMSTGVWTKRQYRIFAEDIAGQNKSNEKIVQEIEKELVLARAHRSVGSDIFITKSPLLLSQRENGFNRDTNSRTPLEASQIIGLFLRSRDIYISKASDNSYESIERVVFYWVLTRYYLSGMWRYFNACETSSEARGDDIEELGESILVRCVRALEARDAIGINFYVPENIDVHDQIMYHFDYLTLVLSGAIDAQARIAHRAYALTTRERNASFKQKEFWSALKKSGANELYNLSTDKIFQSILTLVYEPRNTIHGAALKMIDLHEPGIHRYGLIAVPMSIGQKLLDSAIILGNIQDWGLSQGNNIIWLEPFSYATALGACLSNIFFEAKCYRFLGFSSFEPWITRTHS